MSWKLTNKAGQQVPASDLSGKVVALYFSAQWCPPCRGFTPMLKKFYEGVGGGAGGLQIVFVSGDKSEAEGKDYFTSHHGDWLMLDFAQKGSLGATYGVKGIPSLVVVDASGKSVAADARGQVAGAVEAGTDAMKAVLAEWAKHGSDWRDTAGTSLGGGSVAGSQEAMRAARLARLGGGPAASADAVESAATTARVAPAEPATAAPTAVASETTEPAAKTARVAPAEPTTAAPTAVASAAMAPGDTAAVAQLTDMGFSADQSKQALAAAGGDVQTAAATLAGTGGSQPTSAGGVDADAVGKLTAMGFDIGQVRHALEAAGGDVGAASAILLGD